MRTFRPRLNAARPRLNAALMGLATALAGCSGQEGGAQAAIHQARDRVYPALVMVMARWDVYQQGTRQRAGGSGSGTIIDPVGHVLTNFHVAGKADQIQCQLSNKEIVSARLVGADPWTDLALLQLDMDEVACKAPGATWARLGRSREVQVGDFVLAMGAPLGQARSVSLGVVSCTDRTLSEEIRLPTGEETGNFNVWIQTDASINAGNSGGPLVDMEGRVIGVNSRVLSQAQGVGYSVPVDIARDVVYQIIARGRVRRAWLGLNFQATQDLEEVTGETERGALLREVEPGSPAAEAGLEPQDLLVRLDGEEVACRFTDELCDLRRRIGSLPVGKPVEAVVRRAGKERTVFLTTAELADSVGEDRVYARWGLGVKALTDRMRRQFSLADERGVYVTGARGAAAKAGLLEKDIILRMGGRDVSGLADLDATYERMGKDAIPHLLVQVRRGRNAHFASLRMEEEPAAP